MNLSHHFYINKKNLSELRGFLMTVCRFYLTGVTEGAGLGGVRETGERFCME
jgi:hypothetical protein